MRPTVRRPFLGACAFLVSLGMVLGALTASGPRITTQPASLTVAVGQTATFSVVATGALPLSYQWRKNGVAIAAANSPSYTTPATTAADNGAQFTVVVSNATGSATSKAAKLTVNSSVAPSITTHPVSQTVTAGQTATFSVVASGTGPLSYRWQKNNKSIGGATSPSYTTPTVTVSDTGARFTVVVTNSAGKATSNAATLTVNPLVAPSITAQPISQTIIAGQTATFVVEATGTAPLNYQWHQNGGAIAGATSSSYTTPAATTAESGAAFAVVVANAAGSVTSSAAVLIVNPPGLLSFNIPGINFENVWVGSNSTGQALLTNSGGTNVTINGVALAGPGFSTSGLLTGQVLAPTDTATVTVNFAPAITGSVTGSVTVASNGANSPATLLISGSGVQLDSHAVTLSWTPSPAPAVGYQVYRGATSGGPYALLNQSPVISFSFLDLSVEPGQTYYYVVTSVNPDGIESAYSDEVVGAIPAP